jgi:colanic acid/amylovoran biosynthesis glycosyltransferase
MRIAFLVNAFPLVSETFILDQITGLLDRGHDVEIVARRRGDESVVHPSVAAHGLRERAVHATAAETGAAVRMTRGALAAARAIAARPRHGLRTGKAMADGVRATSIEVLALDAVLRRKRPYDVVHGHFGPNGVLAAHLRRMGAHAAPIVTTYHGIDVTRTMAERGAGFYRVLFEDGDLHLPVSALFRRILVDAGCPPERTLVHHMGVALGDLPFRERRAPEDGVTRLVTVARLVEKKGVEFGVRAVAALARDGRAVRYEIVGDGPRRAEIEALVRSLDLEAVVRVHGWLDRPGVRALLDRAHVLLAPSVTAADGDQEGIPMVLMEAMASGLPVVSTVHSGIPELVEDGVGGHLVPERDVEALAACLARLVGRPESWGPLARAARSRIEAEFDVDALNDRLVELYRRVARG